MKITSLYSLGNLLSGDVVCNCLFHKYSLCGVIQLQLQNVAPNTHCTQQHNQCLLNKTAVFQRVVS